MVCHWPCGGAWLQHKNCNNVAILLQSLSGNIVLVCKFHQKTQFIVWDCPSPAHKGHRTGTRMLGFWKLGRIACKYIQRPLGLQSCQSEPQDKNQSRPSDSSSWEGGKRDERKGGREHNSNIHSLSMGKAQPDTVWKGKGVLSSTQGKAYINST